MMRRWTILLWALMLVAPVTAQPLRIVMVGPPGAGKSTQGKLLASHYHLPHISTGAMLRDHIQRDTASGRQAKEFVEAGSLVPDQLIVTMLKETLAESPGGFVLDGFPRNLSQAETLDRILAEQHVHLNRVIQLDVSDDVVVNRLCQRGRKDDRPKTIRNRLKVYHQETSPILDYYRSKGELTVVDGDGEIQDVQQRIWNKIDPLVPWVHP